VIVIVLALAAIIGGWLLVIAPKRSEASKLAGQVSAEQTKLSQARAQVAQGAAARSSYAHDYTEVARLGEAVPPDDDVPSLIYQVQHAATSAGIDFRDLVLQPAAASAAPAPTPTPTTSATPTSPTPASATPASATPTSSSSPSSSSSAPSAAASAAVSPSAIATLPPGAALGPAGFPVEPFSFSFEGSFFHLANFFERLQRFVVATDKTLSVSGRLMTLNAFSFAPGPKGFPQITASVSATTYLIPASQGLTNGATASGPSPGAPGQPVSSAGSSAPPAAAITAP
jgi:hypothetical protein